MADTQKLIFRSLIFIAGQLMIANAEKLLKIGQSEESLTQLNSLIDAFKKLE